MTPGQILGIVGQAFDLKKEVKREIGKSAAKRLEALKKDSRSGPVPTPDQRRDGTARSGA